MASHDSQPSTRQEDSGNDNFEHALLDTTRNSIRLLRILPDLSSTGLIQCKIWHATTEATYTCLSYMWGDKANGEAILLNGKRISCHNNLWNFLSVARINQVSGSEAFWIDAICIDQTNVFERNHQVRQMGEIYARATDVVAWLGYDQGSIEFLVFLKLLASEDPQSAKDVRRTWYRKSTKGLRRSYQEFKASEYWTRAWITQEILQSHEVSVLVNDTQIWRTELKALLWLLPNLEKMIPKPGSTVASGLLQTTDQRFELYVRAMASGLESTEKTLLSLLFHLGPRKCQIPRDRVHSLLAIVEDAGHLPVDYSMPEHLFISSLVRSYSKSMCLCSLARLTDIIDCVKPFTTSAPQSLLVQYSLPASETTSKHQKTPKFRAQRHAQEQTVDLVLDSAFCSTCNSLVLVDTAKEHIFCFNLLADRCWCAAGYHLVVPKNTKPGHSGPKSTVKLLTSHSDGKRSFRVRLVEILYFGLETSIPTKKCSYSIIIPFESMVYISRNLAYDTRRLCHKAENLLGDFKFVERDNLVFGKSNWKARPSETTANPGDYIR